MYTGWVIYLVCAAFSIASAELNRVAVAHLRSENVTGSIWFTETPEGLHVTGSITGMEPGLYGFHVHELGDTIDCDATAGHFNPEETVHGDRVHEVRHVGDLGNANFFDGEVNSISLINFTDPLISLRGRNNILGRGLVLHANEDDLGLGGQPGSLITGNAGPRVACAVIGMHAPVEAWDTSSSSTTSPSILLLTVVSLFYYFKF